MLPALGALVALAVAVAVLVVGRDGQDPTPSSSDGSPAVPATSLAPTTRPPRPTGFDLARYSLTDPDSPWVVVNKRNPLDPLDHVPELVSADVAHDAEPPLLRPEAARAIEELFAAYRAEAGGELLAQSNYRSFETQQAIYEGFVRRNGQAWADVSSARPGHSEHQTGLATDLTTTGGRCTLDACFADTPAGRWLADNAWRFGWILRYPEGQVEVTGFKFEPWHYRYVGRDLAREMHVRGVGTLEEMFGLPAAPSYDR
ncbi:MAG: M15 family metallopeptidase [Acidimicrobiia bacterium]